MAPYADVAGLFFGNLLYLGGRKHWHFHQNVAVPRTAKWMVDGVIWEIWIMVFTDDNIGGASDASASTARA